MDAFIQRFFPRRLEEIIVVVMIVVILGRSDPNDRR